MAENNKDQTNFDMALASAQLPLLAYIAKLLGNISDAQDVLQNTNLKLCEARERYAPSRPLLPWAKTIARYEVLTWRTNHSRSRLIFSDECVARLADRMPDDRVPLDRRLKYLEICKRRLSKFLQEVLDRHYGERESLIEIARSVGRTPHSLANSCYHARLLLKRCIEEQMQRDHKEGF